jgi:hypothetical protein
MKIELYFTDVEITDYLSKLGYQVVHHKWIEDVPVYHNKTEEITRTTILAIPPDIPIENFLKSYSGYWNISPYRISEVFSREIKAKLLNS